MADEGKQTHGEPWTHHDSLRVGQEFLAAITPDDIAACHYHRANWQAIAKESVRIIAALEHQDAWAYRDAAQRSHLPGSDRWWLVSLFDDPIKIGGGSYSDGQHRGCALRFSGAAQAAVVVRSELIGRRNTDWHYDGDG